MVKIDSNAPIQKANLRRILKSGKSGSSTFSSALSGSADVDSLSQTFALQSSAPLFSLQEVSEKQIAKDRGEKILNLLDQMRHDLLNDNLQAEQLLTLKQTLKSYSSSISDPKLLGILEEIEQRANIELAKRGLI